ncbi:YeeE/YedE family protein [Comamonas thiooxydans]|uniref:YeeE/YedE family protein n=1 Tax=Comamonas thiooxydans TaxID=363952 RepID=UPI000A2E46A8|nr:YeeE/YedE thiosulfate transporter family protein [Comamonas thiooxydans]BDR08761.1 YeeE/YedE family protein [Comamonas thiooxydans]
MNILWSEFTPWTSLVGGLLIGLSAALLIALLGRVAGISGIAGALLQLPTWSSVKQWSWRLAFILGMVAAPLIWSLFAPLPAMQLPSSPAIIIAAGLLVGFGTRMSSGCTSGHGVCGLSRLSLRSLAATATFIATGAITVFVMRHVIA